MASAEDIAAIVAAVLREMKKDGGGNAGGQGRRVIDERNFRRVDKFGGDEKGWKDWSFQVKAALRGTSKIAAEVINWVERATGEITEEDVETQFVEEGDVIEKLGAELYDLLCSITGGEALTIVRAAVDMNGFLAWMALHRRYSPVTPARALAALMEVMCPPKVMDINLVPKAIDSWTLKLTTLEKEFDEKPSARMKLAILLSMVPVDIQDLMYQNADMIGTFEQARDRVKGIINKRLARGKPTPMDGERSCTTRSTENGRTQR